MQLGINDTNVVLVWPLRIEGEDDQSSWASELSALESVVVIVVLLPALAALLLFVAVGFVLGAVASGLGIPGVYLARRFGGKRL